MGDEALGRNITVSGAVLGETIVYNAMAQKVTLDRQCWRTDEVEAAGDGAGHDDLDPTDGSDRLQQRQAGRSRMVHVIVCALWARMVASADELVKCPSRYKTRSPPGGELDDREASLVVLSLVLYPRAAMGYPSS